MATALTSIYEFSEKLHCNQAIEWSKDFRLSLCTESCIRILCLNQEPCNSETRMVLRQSCIPVEKDTFDIPRYDVHQHRDLQLHLPIDDLNSICSDKVMNPFKYWQDVLPQTGFCGATWSPLGADEMGRSILATLSFDCRLMLFTQGKTEYKWSKIADLTEIRREATILDSDYKTTKQFHAYKEWCYSQAVTAISWCPQKFTDVTDGSSYGLLAAGTNAGHVVFWKVKIPCMTASDCSILSTNKEHSKKVMCMAWSEKTGVLAVSRYHGDLTVGQVNKERGTVRWTVLDTSQDLMKVSCMCFCITGKDQEEILIVNKEQYIYGYHLRLDNETHLNVLSKTLAYGLRQLYATGMSRLKDHFFVISSLGGVIEVVEANIHNSELQLKVSSFDTQQPPEQSRRFNGVAVSPNKTFIAYIQRPPPGYDHLSPEWKRPTKLFIRTGEHISQSAVCDTIINSSGPLPEQRDLMEYYRQIITADPDQGYRNEGVMSKRELMLRRFTILSKIAYVRKRTKIKMSSDPSIIDEQTKESEDELVNVSYQIIGYHIQKCVNSLVKPLSQSDFNLLRLFEYFIEKTSNLQKEVLDLVQLQSSIKDALEGNIKSIHHECPICTTSLSIEELNWQCQNGHKFGICCHTLTVLAIKIHCLPCCLYLYIVGVIRIAHIRSRQGGVLASYMLPHFDAMYRGRLQKLYQLSMPIVIIK